MREWKWNNPPRAAESAAPSSRTRNEGLNPLLKMSFHSDSPWRTKTIVTSWT